MNKIFKIFLLFFLPLAVLSCSNYNKIMKGDNYDDKFIEANRQYDNENYSKAIGLYEQVYQYYPRTDKGEVSYYRLGQCYYNDKEYYMAGYYYGQFAKRFPSSSRLEDALFYQAICSVKNSPAVSLDQQETEIALNDLQNFVLRFPESKYMDTCNGIMDNLRLKIETKRYNDVTLYNKMEDYRAAVASAKSFLDDYPQSHFLEEIYVIHFQNAYILALNSILSLKKERIENALELYSNYSYSFDSHSYANRMRRYNDRLKEELVAVNEQYAFNEIKESYDKSQSRSTQKKTYFLEETIKRFNTFAKLYPKSSLMEKAEAIHKKAVKELSNI